MPSGLFDNRILLLSVAVSLAVHAGVLLGPGQNSRPAIDAAGTARQVAMHLHLRQPVHRQQPVNDDPVRPRLQTGQNAAPPRSAPAASQTARNRATKQTTPPVRSHDTLPAPSSEVVTTPAHDENYLQSINDQLRERLIHAIAAHFRYPPMARRHHWQGKVRISLRIEADGTVSHIGLVNSSGHTVLDEAALKSLGRIAQIPGAAKWLRGHHFDMVVPIEYRLLDS